MRTFSLINTALSLLAVSALGQTPEEKALAAFQTSVFAFAKSQRCTACHAVDQAPLWAQGNLAEAYRQAKNFVDFSSPESSTLVARSSNRHCGPICSTDGTAMRDAIWQWWENGEKDLSGGTLPVRKTTELPVPANLPTDESYLPLEWDLASLGFNGVRFQIEIQKFDEYAYRVRSPRMVTSGQAVRVHGVRVYLNGHTFPEASNYLNVTQSATADSAPVLSPTPMLVPSEGAADKIAIGFGEVNWGAPHPCRDVAGFLAKVKPVLEKKCARCHRVAGNTATARYALPSDDDASCLAARQRVDANWPILSALLTYPLYSTAGHPRLLTQNEQDNVLGWIGDEIGVRDAGRFKVLSVPPARE